MLPVSFIKPRGLFGFHFLMLSLKKNLEICNFFFLEVLLTGFWVPKIRLIQSHMSLFLHF